MKQLSGPQIKYLRAAAHHLKPLVMIGAKGITDNLIAAIRLALLDHELIKVKFGEFKETKKTIAMDIARATASELVGTIGNIAILFCQHPEPQKRKIKLP